MSVAAPGIYVKIEKVANLRICEKKSGHTVLLYTLISSIRTSFQETSRAICRFDWSSETVEMTVPGTVACFSPVPSLALSSASCSLDTALSGKRLEPKHEPNKEAIETGANSRRRFRRSKIYYWLLTHHARLHPDRARSCPVVRYVLVL